MVKIEYIRGIVLRSSTGKCLENDENDHNAELLVLKCLKSEEIIETNESADMAMNEVVTGEMSTEVDEVTELNDDDKPKDAEKEVESEDMNEVTSDISIKADEVLEFNDDEQLKDAEKQVECNRIVQKKIEDIWGIILLLSTGGLGSGSPHLT